MGYRRNAKPTPANIRRRLHSIHDAAASGLDLAKRWNPKGRHYVARREAVKELTEIGSRIDRLLLKFH